MLGEIHTCAQSGESFAFETTLSGLGYLRHIRECYFLSLPDVEIAIERVASRVRQGGHDIPEPLICRRFAAGLRNFERYYKASVDAWARYDNVGSQPVLLAWGENT
jgi:predicted ABC-type ATPase